jgi:hypothetical protein
MEKEMKYWSKALEGVKTEVAVLASVKKQSIEEPLSTKKKKGWTASIHWDVLH